MERHQSEQQEQLKALLRTVDDLRDEVDGLKRQNKQLQAQVSDLEAEVEEIEEIVAQIHLPRQKDKESAGS